MADVGAVGDVNTTRELQTSAASPSCTSPAVVQGSCLLLLLKELLNAHTVAFQISYNIGVKNTVCLLKATPQQGGQQESVLRRVGVQRPAQGRFIFHSRISQGGCSVLCFVVVHHVDTCCRLLDHLTGKNNSGPDSQPAVDPFGAGLVCAAAAGRLGNHPGVFSNVCSPS